MINEGRENVENRNPPRLLNEIEKQEFFDKFNLKIEEKDKEVYLLEEGNGGIIGIIKCKRDSLRNP